MATSTIPKSIELFTKANIEIIATRPDFIFKQEDVASLIYATARKSLCFDEHVPLYCLLHLSPEATEQAAKDIAHKVAVQIEAVLSDGNQEKTSQPGRLVRQDSYSGKTRPDQGQVISSASLDMSAQPPSICRIEDHYVVIWTHDTDLPFTKTRSDAPRISCNVILTFQDLASMNPNLDDAESYMEETSSITRDKNYNLLKALEYDVALSRTPPKLTAARVSAMAPMIEPSPKKTRRSAKRLYPVFSAIKLRSRNFEVPHTNRVIISADLGIAPSNPSGVQIDAAELAVLTDRARVIGQISYPFKIHGKESYTVLFEVEHDLKGSGVASFGVIFTVQSRPLIYDHDAENANPIARSKWNVNINLIADISPAIMAKSAPKPGSRVSPINQRSVSSTSMVRRISTMSNTSLETSSRTGLLSTSSALSGLHIRIRNPSSGNVGKTVIVEVSITNESGVTKNLAIEVSRSAYKKGLPQLPKTTDNRARALSGVELSTLHALHKVESLEFICLTNNTKLAPLAAEASIDTKLEYLPLSSGIFPLQDLRIVDLSTGTHQEIRQLPSILILD